MAKLYKIKAGLLCLAVLSAMPSFSQRQKNDTAFFKRDHKLGEVVVHGSNVKRVNRSAYNAVSVDMSKYINTNMNLGQALDRVPGVSVRADGGVGSDVSVNLNGFTGKRVKIFIDGVPMDGSASSFGINNIPAGVASRIDVYKGVVPVEFGSDALGGAINIVTNKSRRTFIDASYSYGSFNTHRSNINLGFTAKNGFTASLTAYQNYSDNDYKVKTQYIDLQTSSYSQDEKWFRRFHDRYHNEAVIAQLGVVGKPWADRLVFGLTYSHEYAQIQNANLMKIVFGGKYRTAEGWTPSLSYSKRNFLLPRLNVNIAARYDIVTTNNVDTLARTYSWTGDYRENAYQGEGVPTLAEYRGKTFALVTNLSYRFGGKHFLTFNNTYTNYRRKTTNSAANAVQSTAATFMRRIDIKNVSGLSYKFVPGSAWNAEVFAKYYSTDVTGPVNIATSGSARYEEQQRSSSAAGYGIAGTWFVFEGFQTKVSYEKTYRLPTDRELFGDGDYEEGDATLRPEKSHNLNLNLSYERTMARYHTINVELGANYRYIYDYIIRTIGNKGTAVSSNHGKVLNLGVDLSARYFYKDVFNIGGGYSLQNMRDRERLTAIGAKSVTYNNRVPNLPYSFGNVDAAYTFKNVLGESNRLTIGYSMKAVHKFFRTWKGNGAKLYIPGQVSHDADITYSLCNGRYNISLEANNFTDALLYDNYSLQKPGRNFSIKFRYSFSKER